MRAVVKAVGALSPREALTHLTTCARSGRVFGRRLGALAAAVAIAAAIVAMMTAAMAGASSRSQKPPVVRPQFRFVADASWLWTGARYALAGLGAPPPLPGVVANTPATLIDDQTGQRTTITRPGCNCVPVSALEPPNLPWIPFDCAAPGQPPVPELYSHATRQWLAVHRSADLPPGPCGGFCDVSYGLRAAGRYWLAYERGICDGVGDFQHCSTHYLYQNLQTGALRQDPAPGSAAVDLNAPDLTRRVCRPLRVPTTLPPYNVKPILGSVTFYGSFAVAIGGDLESNAAYLERCGTHLHRLLTSADGPELGAVVRPAANTREVVWIAHPRPFLSALTLPGLRPFTIRLPDRLVGRDCSFDYHTCVAQIALTNHRLYLLTSTPPLQLWVAANPLPPKRQRK
jgi:hypothetical protein